MRFSKKSRMKGIKKMVLLVADAQKAITNSDLYQFEFFEFVEVFIWCFWLLIRKKQLPTASYINLICWKLALALLFVFFFKLVQIKEVRKSLFEMLDKQAVQIIVNISLIFLKLSHCHSRNPVS